MKPTPDGRSTSRPRVTVIVPHWNTPDSLARCLASIPAACGGTEHEVFVVDNASRLDAQPRYTTGCVMIANSRNRGFAAACNQGAAGAHGEFLCFLNSDAVAAARSIEKLVDVVAGSVALAGAAPVEAEAGGAVKVPARRFLGPLSQALALAGAATRRAPSGRAATAAPRPDWITAAALVVPARIFRLLGGFDEGYFFYEEDEDFCWRARRRGYRVAYCTSATIRHEGGASVRVAGDWPVPSLYAGQLRFVRRRCGLAGALVYRAAVGIVMLAKAAAAAYQGPRGAARRMEASRVLKVLWRGSPAAVTGED